MIQAFRPQPVRVVIYEEVFKLRPAVALVRYPNGKLALMTRERDGTRPWFVRGIGTGYWDTRRDEQNTDFGQVFRNYRKLGATTAFFMIHWMDIEPADGRFDFSYTDQIVKLEEEAGVKIRWVMFLHCQGDHPRRYRDFWAYRLDAPEGKHYAMQWLKDENGVICDSLEKLVSLPGRWEINPAYGHPEMLPRITRMRRRLGEHYRHSPTVLGVQIDNEAGSGYYTPRRPQGPQKLTSDYNPVTLEIFEERKRKTGKSDWKAFKLAIVKYWWRQFTTAFHHGNPYKLTSFNMLGAHAEAGNPYWIELEGVATYGEENIDVVSSMFYGPNNGPKAWANLDERYDFAYELPTFISSEIGQGRRFGSGELFQQYVISSLERGTQGYAGYDYRSLVDRSRQPNQYGVAYRTLAAMIEANEDFIHPGVPGPGVIWMESKAPEMKVGQLSSASATVGFVHWPAAVFLKEQVVVERSRDIEVVDRATRTGRLRVVTFRKGLKAGSAEVTIKPGEEFRVSLGNASPREAVFLRAKPAR